MMDKTDYQFTPPDQCKDCDFILATAYEGDCTALIECTSEKKINHRGHLWWPWEELCPYKKSLKLVKI
jgi:hypothetical protein